jgi:hypothetical protein
LAETKSGALGKQVLDAGPYEEAIVIIGVSDDSIVKLVTNFGEEDVSAL